MKKSLITFLLLLLNNALWALPCYLTVIKDSCWSKGKYDISIDVVDSGAATSPVITRVFLPKEVNAITHLFECKTSQILSYKARFSPSNWQQYEDAAFGASSAIPIILNPGDTAWHTSLCFSKDFSGVPIPHEGTPPCNCDYSIMPNISIDN